MKCACPECKGKGYIPCENCNGHGLITPKLIAMKITPGIANADKLLELQSTAKQVSKQADELSVIFPHNRHVYASQAAEIIENLEREAEREIRK